MFVDMFDCEKKTQNVILLDLNSSYAIQGKMFTQNLTF